MKSIFRVSLVLLVFAVTGSTAIHREACCIPLPVPDCPAILCDPGPGLH